MSWDDDFVDALDVGLEQASIEVQRSIDRLRCYPLVSFYGYRELRYMQGWRPVGLREYVENLQFSERQKIERAIKRSIQAQNTRILRGFNALTTKGEFHD